MLDLPNTMTAHEPFDITHIVKVNRFTLSDSDTAHREFGRQVKEKSDKIKIPVVEGLPQVLIKQHSIVILNEMVKSVDDLKIFLEDRLYKYFEV